jgi:microcystin-dependent protein
MASPVKPSDVQATIPSSTGSICDKLQSLFSLATKMATWFSYKYNEDGTISDGYKDDLQAAGVGVPVGSMVFWPINTIPSGWLAANGQTVSRTTYSGLFAVYGTAYGAGDGSTTFVMPDMRNKFPLGASASRNPGNTGGSETVTLTVPNLPRHKPQLGTDMDFFIMEDTGNGTDALSTTNENILRATADEAFAEIGEDAPFSVLIPYMAGHWIVKI